MTLAELRAMAVDFIISSGYAPIIKEPIISDYAGRIINLHNTYLPYGRGIYPNFWSFFHDTPKGVTIHEIDLGIDSGPILAQRRLEFSADDTLRSSFDRLEVLLVTLFTEIWDDLSTGKLTPYRQPPSSLPVPYRSRLEGEPLLEILPDGWDTLGTTVERMGAEALLTVDFWDQVEGEVAGKIAAG
ncbi:MAG: formyltransferase family protein [Azospirillaceae bacterium]|nr:formyltransferase family protein [Azospirillaceae bacterium]